MVIKDISFAAAGHFKNSLAFQVFEIWDGNVGSRLSPQIVIHVRILRLVDHRSDKGPFDRAKREDLLHICKS